MEAVTAHESDAPVAEAPEPGPEPDPAEEPGERDDGPSPRGLYAKLAEIMGELSAIPSAKMRHVEVATRSGGTYSYDYITEATLMEELRPRLASRGICVFYSDKILRSPSLEHSDDNLTVVQVSLTFVDGETGEKWNSSAEGYGTDLGDKGANKAKTSALRYLLWKTFLFASDLDPETESVERRSRGGNGRGGGTKGDATDKQKGMVSRIASELDEKGVRLDGLRVPDAIHVRTPVEDLTRQQASALIDLLQGLKKSDEVEFVTPEGSTPPLDGLLGAPSPSGDLVDESEGTGPSDGGYA